MERSQISHDKISQFNRIADKFRHGLVIQAIRNKLARLGFELIPYYWVEEGINHSAIPDIKGSFSEYTMEFLNEEDMKMICENARGYSEKKLQTWLKSGKKCFAMRRNDEIASFMWINLKECDFKPIDTPLNKDEAYLTDMYTMEPYRGKNLAPYLRYQSYVILNKMGRCKLYSVSEYYNTSAIKYKQKLNAKNLKLVLFIRIFNKLKWSFTIKSW